MFEFEVVVHHPAGLDQGRKDHFREIITPGLISHFQERDDVTEYNVTVTYTEEVRVGFWISMSELPVGENPDWVCHLVEEVAYHELVDEDDHETDIEVETPEMATAPVAA